MFSIVKWFGLFPCVLIFNFSGLPNSSNWLEVLAPTRKFSSRETSGRFQKIAVDHSFEARFLFLPNHRNEPSLAVDLFGQRGLVKFTKQRKFYDSLVGSTNLVHKVTPDFSDQSPRAEAKWICQRIPWFQQWSIVQQLNCSTSFRFNKNCFVQPLVHAIRPFQGNRFRACATDGVSCSIS